jgi:hypothetical protein
MILEHEPSSNSALLFEKQHLPGFEPGMPALQAGALPLSYRCIQTILAGVPPSLNALLYKLRNEHPNNTNTNKDSHDAKMFQKTKNMTFFKCIRFKI